MQYSKKYIKYTEAGAARKEALRLLENGATLSKVTLGLTDGCEDYSQPEVTLEFTMPNGDAAFDLNLQQEGECDFKGVTALLATNKYDNILIVDSNA